MIQGLGAKNLAILELRDIQPYIRRFDYSNKIDSVYQGFMKSVGYI